MSKFTLKNLPAGKKYKMVIKAKTISGDIDSFPAISFKVPEAPATAKEQALSIQKSIVTAKVGTVVKNKILLTLYIPESVMSSLIYKDDVRDYVHVVYRVAADQDDLGAVPNYLSSKTTPVSYSAPLSFTPPATHPAVFSLLDVDPNRFYSFQYAIARYTKTGGTWTGVWIQSPRKKLKDILSKQAVWGA